MVYNNHEIKMVNNNQEGDSMYKIYDYKKFEYSVYGILRNYNIVTNAFPKAIAMSYLLYSIKDMDVQNQYLRLEDLIVYIDDEQLKSFVFNELKLIEVEDILSLSYFSKEEIRSFLLMAEILNPKEASYSTPKSLIDLALKLLEIKDGEQVGDLCAGIGAFCREGLFQNPNAIYCGIEINTEYQAVARMRTRLLRNIGKYSIVQGNALNHEINIMFDKVFSNYPFGIKLKDLSYGNDYINMMINQCPELSKSTTSDWLFNYKVANSIKENGKAVVIMSNGGTWNTIDEPIRKYFVENHLVETVISLPEKMFTTFSVPTTMIVFSHNNEKINFVDATTLCVQGRRQNKFSDNNIDEIINLIGKNTDKSKVVDLSKVKQESFVLNPSRYLLNYEIENGENFENYILSITRGAPCSAAELDTMVSKSPTNYQYLMLSNIKNGVIDDELPYLKWIEPKYKKYCLKNESLLLSKNGAPFKVAVANVSENKQILANGNLFIIEIDKTKANPYYIKLFLESEKGKQALASITVGATIPNIGISQLNKLQIPKKSLEEQNNIANKYLAALDEISLLKRKISKIENSLMATFDEL